MRRLPVTLSLGLLVGIGAVMLYFYSTAVPSIEKRISSAIPSYDRVLYMESHENLEAAFYWTTEQQLGLALGEADRNQLHLLGMVDSHDVHGLSYTAAEFDELDVYVAYGVVSNPSIEHILVNGNSTEMMTTEVARVWFYMADESFQTLDIIGLDEEERVVYNSRDWLE
ncbi:hypothetical protein [Paenibacillus daejeonensis]|uniref:hypothetical protein n=1 Tax=Paenibacillus daejeonensis TaxID=135193 RepID=UPI0003717046|nr:hypothetical protein [Paenibacillus daejeonensis]